MNTAHLASMLAALSLVATACEAPATAPPSATAAQESDPSTNSARPDAPEKPAPPELSDSTPEDFTRAWAQARSVSEPGAQLAAYTNLSESWSGKRYAWQGEALASLCVVATRTCAVNVFRTSSDPNAGAVGGFFPRVHFSTPAWERLARDCAEKERCVVTFDASLPHLRAEPGRPLTMDFTEAEVTQARPPRPDDPWFKRASSPTPDELAKAKERKKTLRVGTPTSFDASKLERATF